MPAPAKTRCKMVGYLRVSTDKQGQSGLGIEGQQRTVEAYAASCGCVLVATFVEVESGKRNDRPELAKAMAHARRVGATLLVARMDRLARNVSFVSALMESGVDFVACDNPHANRLTIHILAAVAESEAEAISQRTKAALASYKARGGLLGASRPECRNLDDEARQKGTEAASEARKQAAIDSYADLLPVVLESKAAGKTLAAIAGELNADGHTTRTGAAWSPVQVMRMLKRAGE